MAELEAEHKAKQQGATRWREAKEFARLLEMADVVDIQTAAEQYTGKWDQGVVTGKYLDKNTQELAQALSKRQVPVVWNDLIREVERIRKRKNLSPLSASWHRNVGIASSSVLSNWLKPLQKPSGSGSIKCRTQALLV
jgi:hypothetical protein